ncbi:3-phosphoshikimate 1-carboxyvinyltransferase [uncultured Dialister sp.]|uniref:3-phosphoshikimate 1-carboxyvinyltransferase n=1 Tax=uncultured Dialister sp. TaxID=278064 RepID=UPI00259AE1AD|nr:3-phosphoshikimate 1-carboxyvinyltransferase [uncultured Dialister sp.]
MNITIRPAPLAGTLRVPSSKSMTHREIIAAALAKGETEVTGVTWSEDIEATVRILSLFGAAIEKKEGKDGITLSIRGGLAKQEGFLHADAGESGSTLRFLIPLGLSSGNHVVYTGRGRLSERPLTPYYDMFDRKQISYHTQGGLPLEVEGNLPGGAYELPGDVSSQFFTGLLFALPLADEDSTLRSTTPLESKSYVDMTLDTLSRHGITIREKEEGLYEIPGRQHYKTGTFAVEGDYSQAAFWLTAALAGGTLALTGLSDTSLQGDRAIVTLLKDMGGHIEKKEGRLLAEKSSLHGITMDAENVPDLVPAFAALAAVSEGVTEIIHAGRVRLKECDRLHAMAVELNKLGASVEEKPEGLVIRGKPFLSGGTVSSWNDHRIAMALASITPKLTGPLTIEGAESVKKSYPRFWEDFRKVGGKVVEA